MKEWRWSIAPAYVVQVAVSSTTTIVGAESLATASVKSIKGDDKQKKDTAKQDRIENWVSELMLTTKTWSLLHFNHRYYWYGR